MPALRELRADDAQRVAELFVEAFGDARRLDAAEIRSWLRNTELRPGWLRVLEGGDGVVGYGDIMIEGDEVALDVAAPGRWDAFFDWAEGEARRRALGRVRVYVPAGHELADVASARGYRLWRSSYTMEIALDEPPPDVNVPSGIHFGSYDGADAAALRAAIDDAFADDPFHHPLTEGGASASSTSAPAVST